MTILIRNDIQLKKELNDVLTLVLRDASNEVLKILRKNIMTYTYVSLPNKVYAESGKGSGDIGSRMPTFEFLRAFKLKDIKKKSDELTSELFYDWQSMSVNPSENIHYEDGRDTRKKLAEILNIDGYVAHKIRMAYWDKTIQELDSKIDSIFRMAFQRNGLIVK